MTTVEVARAGGLVLLALGSVALLFGLLRPAALPAEAPADRTDPVDPVQRALRRHAGAVTLARQSPRLADTSIRPILARTADALLVARTGRGLGTDRRTAERLLGPELFGFVDPARPTRGHDEGRGLTEAELDRMLDRLEEEAWR